MSSYVGIDLSTHAVDLVKLDEDTDRAEWVRVPLGGGNAIDRARSYVITGTSIYSRIVSEFWDDVVLVALEDPAGRGDLRKIARVQGVVIATIPSRVQVWTFAPGEWRKLCGLPGNASKTYVRDWAIDFDCGEQFWTEYLDANHPQDVLDAFAIAFAARALNEQQEAS